MYIRNIRFIIKSILIVFIIFSLSLIFISCTNSQNNNSNDLNSDKSSIIEFAKSYREYAQEFDKKNVELFSEFEELNTIDEGIVNLNKRIENAKRYKSQLSLLSVPSALDNYYSLKMREIDYGIEYIESTISFYLTGEPDIPELQNQQQQINEYSQESYNEILRVLKSYNLEYLMD